MRFFYHRQAAGFTLVELLVSMTILAVLVVMLAEGIATVSHTWQTGVDRVDNFSKARTILGLLDRDIQGVVLRPDVGTFLDGNGNSACAFYSRIDGTTNRRLSLVSYTLTTNATNSVLERASYSMDYATSLLSLGTTNALPDVSSVSKMGTPQDVAPGVLFFQIQFLSADGTLWTNFYYDYSNPDSSFNTKGVVASLLVVDNTPLLVAQQTGTLSTLMGKFSGTPGTNQTYAQYWNGVLASTNFSQGLPKPLLSGVRVFEGHISLP